MTEPMQHDLPLSSEQKTRPAGIVLIAICTALAGLFFLLAGVGLFLQGELTSIPMILGLLFGTLLMTTAYGLWVLKAWSYSLTRVIYAIIALGSLVVFFASGISLTNGLVMAVSVGALLYLEKKKNQVLFAIKRSEGTVLSRYQSEVASAVAKSNLSGCSMEMTSKAKHQSSPFREFYYSSVFYPIRWYIGIGLLIAFLPEPLVAESLLLTQLVESAKAWIPSIAKLGVISTFPTVTGLYLIVMWVLFPVALVKFWLHMPSSPLKPIIFKTIALGLACMVAGIAMTLSVLYWFPFNFEDSQISMMAGRSGASLYLITHSKLGFGMFVGGFFWILLMGTSYFIYIIKYLIQKSFQSDFKH